MHTHDSSSPARQQNEPYALWFVRSVFCGWRWATARDAAFWLGVGLVAIPFVAYNTFLHPDGPSVLGAQYRIHAIDTLGEICVLLLVVALGSIVIGGIFHEKRQDREKRLDSGEITFLFAAGVLGSLFAIMILYGAMSMVHYATESSFNTLLR